MIRCGVLNLHEESFVERLLHRLIRSQIAGTTISNALSKARELNKRGFPATIEYLYDNIDDKQKARYVRMTYEELVRRASSIELNVSVHVPAYQLGYRLDYPFFKEQLNELINTTNQKGTFLWLETDTINGIEDLLNKKGFGIAIRCDKKKKIDKVPSAVKLIYYDQNGKEEKIVKNVIGKAKNVVVHTRDEKIVKAISKIGKGKVTFELPLGFSKKKMEKMARQGVKISVFVPFGKAWMEYATRSMPNGYIKRIAASLLKRKIGESYA
ncbi:MAG: hypothetical protein QXL16_01360 [Candidatus Micrarchaeaceae archaeon]